MLHVRVADVRYGAIRVCGHSRKESMAHPVFELDPNYAFPETKPDDTGLWGFLRFAYNIVHI